MPMFYANEAAVIAHLKIKPEDAAAIERAVNVENGLVETFDGMVGRAFGVASVTETRTFDGGRNSVLVIPSGILAIDSIEVAGSWDGTAWVDGDVIAPSSYRMLMQTRDGIAYGIAGVDRYWDGPVRVSGIFADQPTVGVPADVVEALTVATVKEYRRLTSSPQEMVGPDGLAIPTPSGLNDPHFKAAVERHRLVEVVV